MRKVLFLLMLCLLMVVNTGGLVFAEEVRDLGSITLIVSDWSANGLDLPKENKMVLDEIQKRLLEERNVKLDINVKPFAGSILKDRLNVMFASQAEFDAYGIFYGFQDNQAQKPGLLLPLNDLLEERGQNLRRVIPESAWRACTYDGEIKIIPGLKTDIPQGTYIRKDLLDKAGLDVPSSIKELEVAFAKFKEMDYIPYIGRPDYNHALLAAEFDLTLGVGKFDSSVDENGNVFSQWLTENEVNYLTLIRKWVDKGWLPMEFMTYTTKQVNNMWKSGKVASIVTMVAQMPEQNLGYGLEEVVPEAEITFIPLLESGKRRNQVGLGNCVVIPSWAENPEGMIEYWDWVYSSPKNMMLVAQGIEGVHYDMNWETGEMVTTEKYQDPNVDRYQRYFSMWQDFQSVAGYLDVNTHPVYKEQYRYLKNLKPEQKLSNPLAGINFSFSNDEKALAADITEEWEQIQDKYVLGELSVEELRAKQKSFVEKYEPLRKVMQETYDKFMSKQK